MIAIDVTVGRGEPFESDAGKVFRGRHPVEDDCLVAGQRGKKIHYLSITCIGEKGVIPEIDDEASGDRLDFGEVHHHAIVGLSDRLDHLAGERDFQRIAVAVEMPALAGVVRDAVSGVELDATGDFHEGRDNLQFGIIFRACAP